MRRLALPLSSALDFKAMFAENSLFEAPSESNTRIWRYMDFTKFVSLLEEKSLFFCRADLLGDAYEGSYPESFVEQHLKLFGCTKDAISPSAGKFLHFLGSFRKVIGISSWHVSPYESAAMWRLYLQNSEGIAVRSTYERLRASIEPSCHRVHIGLVKYIDFKSYQLQSENLNFFEPYLLKRLSYEHEREIRAIAVRAPASAKDGSYTGALSEELHSKDPIPNGGLKVECDVSKLIEAVHIAPSAPSWFYGLMQSVMSRYEINAELLQSQLSEGPLV
jgi:hypothetical protein